MKRVEILCMILYEALFSTFLQSGIDYILKFKYITIITLTSNQAMDFVPKSHRKTRGNLIQ